MAKSDRKGKPLQSPLTDRCPKGRLRIRRDVLPELVAWLLTIGNGYERQLLGILNSNDRLAIPGMLQCAAYAKQSLRTIQSLINCACDKFDESEFEAAKAQFIKHVEEMESGLVAVTEGLVAMPSINGEG